MSNTEKILEFQFPAKPESLCSLREKLKVSLAPFGNEEMRNCVILAVSEACVNIIEHAYGDKDSGDIIIEIKKQFFISSAVVWIARNIATFEYDRLIVGLKIDTQNCVLSFSIIGIQYIYCNPIRR